jgi:hypothetical protein
MLTRYFMTEDAIRQLAFTSRRTWDAAKTPESWDGGPHGSMRSRSLRVSQKGTRFDMSMTYQAGWRQRKSNGSRPL